MKTRAIPAQMNRIARTSLSRLADFEHTRLTPWLIAFATHPLHTLWMLFLWTAILALSAVTPIALFGGNYFNGLAGVIGCLTLASVGAAHQSNQQQHAAHREQLTRHAEHLARIETLLQAQPGQATSLPEPLATPATPATSMAPSHPTVVAAHVRNTRTTGTTGTTRKRSQHDVSSDAPAGADAESARDRSTARRSYRPR